MLSSILKEIIVAPLIEYDDLKYWSLFKSTSPLEVWKYASILSIPLKGSDLNDWPETLIVCWFKFWEYYEIFDITIYKLSNISGFIFRINLYWSNSLEASKPINHLLPKELQWSPNSKIGFCGDWFDMDSFRRVESAMNT